MKSSMIQPWFIWITRLIFIFLAGAAAAQETNTQVSGVVRTASGELLPGATVTMLHEPTGNRFITQTGNNGYFYFFNLKPGGPYILRVSYTGFVPKEHSGIYIEYFSNSIFLGLGESGISEIRLQPRSDTLQEVKAGRKGRLILPQGIETLVTDRQLSSLPSISRNFQDFVRLVPQALVKSDGSISLAGQNSRYNAFFIDGANNNDLLGLAPNGINGGQAATPPISLEAVEEINIKQAPYDVQYGNFTGGGINAITRSGSNEIRSAAWFYFRNEKMAGRSPVPLEVSGFPGVFKRQRLSPFFNHTSGAWVSGPLIKNKLFYFLLGESQQERQEQPYNFADYRGNSPESVVSAFADTLRYRYGYEPGRYNKSRNNLAVTRINMKLDWALSSKNKFTLSYRYNDAERISQQTLNSGTTLRFENNQYRLTSLTHALSLELKTYFNNRLSNRLLVTYSRQVDDRDITGNLFPQVQVQDGAALVTAGSNGSAQLNIFRGQDLSCLDVLRWVIRNQVITAGAEFNYSRLHDVAQPLYFGGYRFRSFSDFFNNAFPVRFTRTVSLVDEPADDRSARGARYSTRRVSFFIHHESALSARLRLNAGIRLDGNAIPGTVPLDDFFQTTARPAIEKYYDLEGALPGQLMKTQWQLSPRFGFSYRVPRSQITLRGGAGLFTGHFINIRASEINNVNLYAIDITPQLFNLRFNPDPYRQPGLQDLGLYPEAGRGNITIISRNYKYPVVFRSSLSAEKKWIQGWKTSVEWMFTANIHENCYTNVNLIPPVLRSNPPGSRNVYSPTGPPPRIDLSVPNPYNNIYLIHNNPGKKGLAWNFNISAVKQSGDELLIQAAYSYGISLALFEQSGGVISSSQWSAINSVNGKNYAARGRSSYELGHRLYVSLTKTFRYAGNKTSSVVSLFYNGQSGASFSYVYAGSLVNDNGQSSSQDLLYIPAPGEMAQMRFNPNTVNGRTYSEEEQRQMLDDFIEKDRYLRRHRGQFAEPNGARLPFTHTVDLRVQQDFVINSRKKPVRISVIYDVFNLMQMLNPHWGRIYLMGNDSYPLIQFDGYTSASDLTPKFRFNPLNGSPWSVQTSTAPGSSARWISQLGLRIQFN